MTEAERTPTLFEWMGGAPAIRRLFVLFYDEVPNDPVLAPIFAGMPKEHARHVAAFIAEVFGGPSVQRDARQAPVDDSTSRRATALERAASAVELRCCCRVRTGSACRTIRVSIGARGVSRVGVAVGGDQLGAGGRGRGGRADAGVGWGVVKGQPRGGEVAATARRRRPPISYPGAQCARSGSPPTSSIVSHSPAGKRFSTCTDGRAACTKSAPGWRTSGKAARAGAFSARAVEAVHALRALSPLAARDAIFESAGRPWCRSFDVARGRRAARRCGARARRTRRRRSGRRRARPPCASRGTPRAAVPPLPPHPASSARGPSPTPTSRGSRRSSPPR